MPFAAGPCSESFALHHPQRDFQGWCCVSVLRRQSIAYQSRKRAEEAESIRRAIRSPSPVWVDMQSGFATRTHTNTHTHTHAHHSPVRAPAQVKLAHSSVVLEDELLDCATDAMAAYSPALHLVAAAIKASFPVRAKTMFKCAVWPCPGSRPPSDAAPYGSAAASSRVFAAARCVSGSAKLETTIFILLFLLVLRLPCTTTGRQQQLTCC